MNVILRPFGTLQRYFGESRIEIHCASGTTFFELCDVIEARWGSQLPPSLWDAASRRFVAQVIVMIGGKGLTAHENPILSEGQEILFLLPFAGG
jgi:hypothetical protein